MHESGMDPYKQPTTRKTRTVFWASAFQHSHHWNFRKCFLKHLYYRTVEPKTVEPANLIRRSHRLINGIWVRRCRFGSLTCWSCSVLGKRCRSVTNTVACLYLKDWLARGLHNPGSSVYSSFTQTFFCTYSKESPLVFSECEWSIG